MAPPKDIQAQLPKTPADLEKELRLSKAELKKAAQEFAKCRSSAQEALAESNRLKNLGIQKALDTLEKAKTASEISNAIKEIKKCPSLSKKDLESLDKLEKQLLVLRQAKTRVDAAYKRFVGKKRPPNVAPKPTQSTPQNEKAGIRRAQDSQEFWVANTHGGYDIFFSQGNSIRSVKDTTQSSTYYQRGQLKAEANTRRSPPPVEVISRIEREGGDQKSPPSTPYRAPPPRQPDKASAWVRKPGT